MPLLPDPGQLAVFVVASVVLLVIPGPAVIYIVTRSATHGRSAGLASMAGVHAGTFVHVIGAVVGISALLVASATLYSTVKLAGAVYLIYLGVRALLARSTPLAEGAPRPAPVRRLVTDGFIVGALNPKPAIFFLAFLPQFVDPSAGPAWSQSLALGTLFIALAVVSDGAYALLAAHAAGWFRAQGRARLLPRLRWFEGGLLVTLGIASAAGARTSQ
jgi:threonine/homoserine/homoserine lactone efflux protein